MCIIELCRKEGLPSGNCGEGGLTRFVRISLNAATARGALTRRVHGLVFSSRFIFLLIKDYNVSLNMSN